MSEQTERRYVRIPVSFLIYVWGMLSGGVVGAGIVLVAIHVSAAPAILGIGVWLGVIVSLLVLPFWLSRR